MSDEIIKKSIEKNELQLSFWDAVKHYAVSFVLLIFFFIPVFLVFKSSLETLKKANLEALIYMAITPFVIAILLGLIQKKRLRFKVVVTELDRSLVDKVVDDTALQLGWIFNQRKKNYIEASTRPGFLSGSWGEQITIIFDGDRILINSICDLNEKTSLVSMGRNKKNERTFIKNVNNATSQIICSVSQ